MTTARFGIFSGYDPRPWVMEDCAETDIKTLEDLVQRLSGLDGIEIFYPGENRKGYDKLCYTTELGLAYAEEFAEQDLAGIINVHQTWTFPQTSQKVLISYYHRMKAQDATFRPRILLVSIQDTTVPGMVSGMALGGGLSQIGLSFSHVYGDFAENETTARIAEVLDVFSKRKSAETRVKNIVNTLHELHALEFGSFSLQMPTTRINQEELAGRWGITSENMDQQVFLDRAFDMMTWEEVPGKSKILEIKEPFVQKIVEAVYDRHSDKFIVVPGQDVPRDKFALQVAMYVAIEKIVKEKGASAVTIKCQDECSGNYCTCCIATSYLSNSFGPLGNPKKTIPTSCETDLPTMYTQYLLYKISGKPSGFGDFRYVKTDASDKTLLAIVNCGQHPAYYAGQESDPVEEKIGNIEYPGQEHFYAAGGAAVRMRTAGNQTITVARLGVENGRLYLVGTVMHTIDVPVERHLQYNKAWPIIEGYVPVTDCVLGKQWPSNHLGFVYGDYIAELIETAERMGIGYRVWDEAGTEYAKAS